MRKKMKLLVATLQLMMCSIMFPMRAEAAGQKKNPLMETKLYKGAESLATDFLIALIVISAIITAALCGYQFFRYQSSADEEKPKHMKNIKSTAIAGVGIICVESIVTVVFSYFQ